MHITIPDLRRFDDVVFELNPRLDGPRWELNVDKGYSGQFAEGWIKDINEYAVQVIAKTPSGERFDTAFPNYASSDYDINQWSYPGYLKRKTQIPECDCGCKDLGYHWNFCQRKKYLDAISS